MRALIRRRWLTAALLVWLPLVKVLLPGGVLRFALFYGGGAALAALAIRREGDAPAVRPLLAAPWRGAAAGVGAYGLLVAGATLLLYWPALQPFLPWAVYDLAALLDPLPVYLHVKRGDPWPGAGMLALVAAGSLAEEWIFRVALLWRWLPAAAREGPPRLLAPAGALLRIVAVSAYFAALHWPQAPQAVAVAFLGSAALGVVLLWGRSYPQVGVLHLLFNWRLLL